MLCFCIGPWKDTPVDRPNFEILRAADRGALRGPRLAQGAEKTRQLSCFIEGVYQGTTYPKRTGLRADLTVPRAPAARAVQIDFRRGAVKPVKRGAFSRVCIGELES